MSSINSIKHLKRSKDYKEYRDRHENENDCFPGVDAKSVQRNSIDLDEAKQMLEKMKENFSQGIQNQNRERKQKGLYTDISNLNYLNYDRESSKEYARKKDDQKFKAHRKTLSSRIQNVLD